MSIAATPLLETTSKHVPSRRERRSEMDNASTIEMKFVRTSFFTRWPCTFCGGCTEKVAILCEAEGLRACEQCLEAGQDRLDDRLRKSADVCEARATALRGLIGRVKIPTYAAWEAAEKADDDKAAAEDAAWMAACEKFNVVGAMPGPVYDDGSPIYDDGSPIDADIPF
jgi:hypothetical protein